jgi:hypothetical protein
LPLALAAAAALPARAEQGALSGPLEAHDTELDERFAFLSERLDAGRRNAQIWQYGFTSGYSLGVVIGAVQAGLEDGDERVSGIVTSAKGAIGAGRLLWDPHPARLGAEPLRALPRASHAERVHALAEAEALVAEIVERAESRWTWPRHTGNVALNLAGGAFIWGFDDVREAAVSTGVGILVGEIMIFTTPWRIDADVADYRQHFDLAGASALRWRLEPFLREGAQGVALRVEW